MTAPQRLTRQQGVPPPPPGVDDTGDGRTQLQRKRADFARPSRVVDWLFLATLVCVTFEKLHWNIAGAVGIADVLAVAFIVAFLLTRTARGDGRVPRTVLVVVGFACAFLLVYLVGFFNRMLEIG